MSKNKNLSAKQKRKLKTQSIQNTAIAEIKNTDTEQQLPDGIIIVEEDTDVVELETSLAAQYAVEDALEIAGVEMVAVEEVAVATSCAIGAYIEKQFEPQPIVQSKPTGKLSLAEVMAARLGRTQQPTAQTAPVKVETHIPRLSPAPQETRNVVHQLPRPKPATEAPSPAKIVQLTPVTEREAVSVILPEEIVEPQFIEIGGVHMPTGLQVGFVIYLGGMLTPILVTNVVQTDATFKTRRFHTFEGDESVVAEIDSASNRMSIAIIPVNFEYGGSQRGAIQIHNLTTARKFSEQYILAKRLEEKITNMSNFALHEGQYRSTVTQFELTDIVAQILENFDKYEDAIEALKTFDLATVLSLVYSDDSLRNCVVTVVVNKGNGRCSVLCLHPVKSV